MIEQNLLEDDVGSVLATALETATSPVYLVNPAPETITELVSVLGQVEASPTVRVLAQDGMLKDVFDDFIVASRAANHVDDGTLALRTTDRSPHHSLLVDTDAVVSIVESPAGVAGVVTTDEDFVADTHDYCGAEWDHAETYNLRTPPLASVRSSLETDIGPDAAADFDAVLSSLQTARGDGDGLDEVTISLLVAARNNELLYDISKWGEDVGLASKATFSRTKTSLEEAGLIDTEKVPIDVGRPRLRLTLGDDRLADAPADEMASVAQSIIAS